METTKYYCDECGEELNPQRCLTVKLLFVEQYRNDYLLNNSNEYIVAYDRVLCPCCVGEEVKWGQEGEGSRRLSLSEKGGRLLRKLGVLKPKLVEKA